MVSDLTIQRFFSVHYVVPIAGAGILLFHLLFLHGSGSGALTGTQGGAVDAGGFGVVYWKDMLLVLFILSLVVSTI